jgi:hypothetical protein
MTIVTQKKHLYAKHCRAVGQIFMKKSKKLIVNDKTFTKIAQGCAGERVYNYFGNF